MPERSSLSVVIPTIGRPELLRACLASLAASTCLPAEVVVVDQSADASAADVLAAFPELAGRAVRSHPPGIARAMNDGLAAVTSAWVLVTHDDCTVDPDWVATGARLADQAGAATIVTGAVFPAGDDPESVPSTKTDPHSEDFTGQRRWNVLYPANMLLPVRTVLDAGAFDERFQHAAEDNDLCYRWLTAGRRLEYRPELVVQHHDWRTPEQLGDLYQSYWRGTGQLYGKHLRAGDPYLLAALARDLAFLARSYVPERIGGDPARRGDRTTLRSLATGVREGWQRPRPRR